MRLYGTEDKLVVVVTNPTTRRLERIDLLRYDLDEELLRRRLGEILGDIPGMGENDASSASTVEEGSL